MSSLHPQVKCALAPHQVALMDRLLANCLVAPPLRDPGEWWRPQRGRASDETLAPHATERARVRAAVRAATERSGDGIGEEEGQGGCADACVVEAYGTPHISQARV